MTDSISVVVTVEVLVEVGTGHLEVEPSWVVQLGVAARTSLVWVRRMKASTADVKNMLANGLC